MIDKQATFQAMQRRNSKIFPKMTSASWLPRLVATNFLLRRESWVGSSLSDGEGSLI
jgi:hypothetical protein